MHAFLHRAACARTIGAVHPPPAILLSCVLPRAPGVRKDGTFESAQHVCERAARTSRVLDMAAVSRLRRSRLGLIPRNYPVLCALHAGRALSWQEIKQQRQTTLPKQDQPETRSRSLLSRSRVNRAVEAARRVGGGLIVAALNVGGPPQRSRCCLGTVRRSVQVSTMPG